MPCPPDGPRPSSHSVSRVPVPSSWGPERPLEEAPETTALTALTGNGFSSEVLHQRTPNAGEPNQIPCPGNLKLGLSDSNQSVR